MKFHFQWYLCVICETMIEFSFTPTACDTNVQTGDVSTGISGVIKETNAVIIATKEH